MSNVQIVTGLPKWPFSLDPLSDDLMATSVYAERRFATVTLVENTTLAQVRDSIDLEHGPIVISGSTSSAVRLVTSAEDRVLRRAAMRGAKVVHGGVLAPK